jgi:hypothetical protein
VSDPKRHELLSGLTAWQWEGLERFVLVTSVLGGMVGVALVIVRPPVGWWVPVATVLIFSCLVLVGLNNIFVTPSRYRAAAERRAGYTTRPEVDDLDLVVPPTGRVVRAAGRPKVSRREYRELCRRERSRS